MSEERARKIAEKAYHRWLKRGGHHGRDFDDWLEAERELQQEEAKAAKKVRRKK